MGEQKQDPASGEAGEEGRAGRGPLTASWRMGGKVRTLTAGGRAFEMKRSGGTKAEKSMFKEKIPLVCLASLKAVHLPEHGFESSPEFIWTFFFFLFFFFHFFTHPLNFSGS